MPADAPLTEEEILASAVGELVPHAATIELADYDPSWPDLFRREDERIRAILGDRVLLLEHVGSTVRAGARREAAHRHDHGRR